MRMMLLSATLVALAACSTHDNLLAPDDEADQIISPERNTSRVKGRGVDPVCGAPLDDLGVTWNSSHQGSEYYFDSEACKRQFDSNPELYGMTAR